MQSSRDCATKKQPDIFLTIMALINLDIRQAHTLPSMWYRSEDIYRNTIERAFPSSWQYVADVVPQHHHTLEPATILPQAIGEPILIKRASTHKGSIRPQSDTAAAPADVGTTNTNVVSILSNVCTHRGTILVSESCSPREIRCPYHGRRFDLRGRCIHMPEFTEVEGFPSEADHLSPLPHFTIGPMVFARIAAPESAGEQRNHEVEPLPADGSLQTFPSDLTDLLHQLSPHSPLGRKIAECELQPSGSRTFEINAHWALYVENYLEGFHVPFVHGGLNAVLDYGAYETQLYPGGVLQVGIGKSGESCFEELPGNVAALYYWLFPNTMINVYPWGISLNVVEPAGLSRTLVHYRVYVMDEAKIREGAGADLDRVELEDDAIVESVHRGMRSRVYVRGRYSATREQGVHHFHRMISRFG